LRQSRGRGELARRLPPPAARNLRASCGGRRRENGRWRGHAWPRKSARAAQTSSSGLHPPARTGPLAVDEEAARCSVPCRRRSKQHRRPGHPIYREMCRREAARTNQERSARRRCTAVETTRRRRGCSRSIGCKLHRRSKAARRRSLPEDVTDTSGDLVAATSAGSGAIAIPAALRQSGSWPPVCSSRGRRHQIDVRAAHLLVLLSSPWYSKPRRASGVNRANRAPRRRTTSPPSEGARRRAQLQRAGPGHAGPQDSPRRLTARPPSQMRLS